ncbi:isocitrate lyase/phosphoenolpyruvate mutase family protein [Micromonospora sp. WMMD1082]|uniref:isocitrate lyase/phosphoenolpyruvate mutase family protein n=1 Tax=Micromonospora sp. WMMD1082 TaxID=3016104 RepID=UPI002415BC22|nr:isocitrate lyase/phosphoenolpyruvate mutase family protein [Micromonospora sp. WMMD1082]MDG4795539.1 isocitrate lyase/phosphoenolpyruvate mutase family protein [Micromonospora sp. WMMD1082]
MTISSGESTLPVGANPGRPAGSPSLAEALRSGRLVRAAGAHSALTASLVEQAGMDAVWASSFEISAARCLPDASLLTMTEYLTVAAEMQKCCSIPVVADVDTGFGGTMNVAHMVREYESRGITAVCMEDKLFPKMNSFVAAPHCLLPTEEFCRKLEVAKAVQREKDFHLIARTEALISGQPVTEALERCRRYADAGADSVLVHSKDRTNRQVLEFLAGWDERVPVVIVPTTYPDWHADDARRAGISMVIYANHGLRAMIRSTLDVLRTIREEGSTVPVEDEIASINDVFRLQHLDQWRKVSE